MSLNNSDAIFSIGSKSCEVTVSAFEKKLCFGPLKQNRFEAGQFFEIALNDVFDFFCALFYIVKSFTTKIEANGLLIQKTAEMKYTWRTLNKENFVIAFNVETNETIQYQIEMTLLQFNDILFLISNLLIYCLTISCKERLMFQKILQLNLDQILKFKTETILAKYLQEQRTSFDLTEIEMYRYCLLIFYNLDVIVAIHNIKSLYNPALSVTQKNINQMLSCN